jgi:hypothetical protein
MRKALVLAAVALKIEVIAVHCRGEWQTFATYPKRIPLQREGLISILVDVV